jgi:dienelactone hydrolase
VVFYGIPPEQAAKPADIKIPLQAHFANKDDWCTPELVNGFEKAMKTAGKSLELFAMTPNTPSSTSSGKPCTIARRLNWPGPRHRVFQEASRLGHFIVIARSDLSAVAQRAKAEARRSNPCCVPGNGLLR